MEIKREKFDKSFDELFINYNKAYETKNNSVKIKTTLFDKSIISVENSFLNSLKGKRLGGEIINGIYHITCYRENDSDDWIQI